MVDHAHEYDPPQEPGLMTHVALIDEASVPPHSVRAIGRGADDAEALLDLCRVKTRCRSGSTTCILWLSQSRSEGD
jgi:hypothetical protein